MKKIYMVFLVLFIISSFFLQLLGLMKLLPFYLTSPVLFISFLLLVITLNNRKRFKGL
ncbi:hypothetical protein JMM81_04835 [Bacillus sp. V3B]|uniref:hypothetical protein n=1 Tax=Bacillus sp. V3B TaxID=2804915 RepID=UPI00210C9C58|nr:hypothetical protein [Bacillus sp. V3B]MCQ6274302.1 hypothetical protein [Bacillus sp. V3B]